MKRKKYIEGENINKTDLVVEATYKNGQIGTIQDFEIENGNSLFCNQDSITIRYKDAEVVLKIEVIPLDDIKEVRFEDQNLFKCFTVEEKDGHSIPIEYVNCDIENKIVRYEKSVIQNTTQLYISNDLSNNNKVENLSGISEFSNIKNLLLIKFSDITDITEISRMKNIEKITFMSMDSLENIEQLANLSYLKQVEFRYCDKIKNIGALENITSLETIEISNTPVDKIGNILELPKLSKFCILDIYETDFSRKVRSYSINNKKIILPDYFSKIVEKDNTKIKAEIQYWGEDEEIIRTNNLEIKQDEKKRLFVEMDNNLEEGKEFEKRCIIIEIPSDNGVMSESILSIDYIVHQRKDINIDYEEIDGEKYIIKDCNIKATDIINEKELNSADYIYEIYDEKQEKISNDSNLGTGYKIKIVNNVTNEKIDEYIVTLIGDVDCNAQVDLYDIMRLIELVFDTGEEYKWDKYIELAGKCTENSTNTRPDLYDILRLIEYQFDNKNW